MAPSDAELGNDYTEDRSFTNESHFSNKSDERGTPVKLARQLKRALGGLFDTDPCSGCEPEPIARIRYNIEDDGLIRKWVGAVFCNPPYSDIKAWMEKCATEARRDEVDFILALVPNRTSTQWFHRHATEAEVFCVVEGRLAFEHTPGPAPFPSAIFGFGDVPESVLAVLHSRGAVYEIEDESPDQVRLTEMFSDNEEPETTILRHDELHELRSVHLNDEIILHVDKDVMGCPDVGDVNPVVHVESGMVRNSRQELLTYDREEEIWYLIMYPVVGEGRVVVAVEVPGNGWQTLPLNKVELK